MDAKTNGRAGSEPRLEDDALVRGHGRFMADVWLPDQAYACFVRSPHAFARIASIETEAAAASPGIVGILTGKDTGEIGSISSHPPLPGRGGKPLIMPFRPALAAERVTHIGEGVAMVVAETAAAAQDAAELVAIDYEPLTPVMDARAALAPGAPQVWPEAPGNLAIDWPGLAADPEANAREVDAIFAKAKFVARVALTNQRMAMASMEPRGATAQHVADGDSFVFAGVLAGRPHHARQPCHDHENPADAAASVDRRCRRRVRAENRRLSGIRRALDRRQKIQPPDSLDVGTLRGFPQRQSGARYLLRSRACARRQGALFGAAHSQRRQSRCLHRPSRRGDPEFEFRALSSRHVRHSSHRPQRTLCVHPYGADRALSRRRAARGELRA